MRKSALIGIISIMLMQSISGQELFQVLYAPGDKYKITEFSNLRKRVNGTYVGFIYREVKGILDVLPRLGGGFNVEGSFYVFEETTRDGRLIANQIDEIVPVSFSVSPDGTYKMTVKSPYPLTQDFPVFPNKKLKPGDGWQAYGVRNVDPTGEGAFTRVRFYCDYKYNGEQEKDGKKYHIITAQYALRYKQGQDLNGDKRLKEIKNGGHQVTIKFDWKNAKPVSMHDAIMEQYGEVYVYNDGTEIMIKGYIDTFFDMIRIMDKDKVVEEITKIIEDDNIEDTTVDESEEGVKLTLNNIHFVADQAIILPDEKPRLDSLAETLKKIKDRTFLVVGHTAKAGTEKEQYELSVKRAKAMVDYFVSRGLEEKRFLYEGRGAKEPIAPNDTEENMRKNRRVEIYILED